MVKILKDVSSLLMNLAHAKQLAAITVLLAVMVVDIMVAVADTMAVAVMVEEAAFKRIDIPLKNVILKRRLKKVPLLYAKQYPDKNKPCPLSLSSAILTIVINVYWPMNTINICFIFY